jgi:hypothetical protein
MGINEKIQHFGKCLTNFSESKLRQTDAIRAWPEWDEHPLFNNRFKTHQHQRNIGNNFLTGNGTPIYTTQDFEGCT